MAKTQILVIHGGETFDTYEDYVQYLRDYPIERILKKNETKRWKDRLQDDLGDHYEVIMPTMPSARNAKYEEWQIWVDKYLPILHDNIVLIGHSLGATFLAKHLSEKEFPVEIAQLYLIAGCYDCASGFELGNSLEKIEQQIKKIYIYHSMDDPVVDFADAQKFKEELPTAKLVTFTDRGHFLDEQFPELLVSIVQ